MTTPWDQTFQVVTQRRGPAAVWAEGRDGNPRKQAPGRRASVDHNSEGHVLRTAVIRRKNMKASAQWASGAHLFIYKHTEDTQVSDGNHKLGLETLRKMAAELGTSREIKTLGRPRLYEEQCKFRN